MARFPEQRLWDRIRRNIGREVHIERIENSVAAGTPDTLVIHKGAVTFVEHKTATLPAKKTTRLQWRHPLTAPQRNWHLTWCQNGGRSYIVVGIDKELFAVPGRFADEVTDMTAASISPWLVTMNYLAFLYKKGAR
jgi:hypothetical protein